MKWHVDRQKKRDFLNYKSGLKSSYDDVISVVDDIFDKQDPSSATVMGEVYI